MAPILRAGFVLAVLCILPAVAAPPPMPIEAPLPGGYPGPAETVRTLSRTIGHRQGGSRGEERAAEWLAAQLRDAGYAVEIQEVPIPIRGRASSRNVIGRIGSPPYHLVGAHMDTKRGPGADDNASGCAAILEVARRLRASGIPLMIVFFGAEEMQTGRREDHHYGSRRLAASLGRADIATMTNVDMVGVGERLHVRGMEVSPGVHARSLLAAAIAVEPGASWLGDRTGLSDHEAFAARGWPHAWLQRRPNDNIHSPADTVVNPALIDQAVTILARFLSGLSR